MIEAPLSQKVAMSDTYSSGPFSRVFFWIDEKWRLQTYTYSAAKMRVESARTQIATLTGVPRPGQHIETFYLNSIRRRRII